jgi:zinc protease
MASLNILQKLTLKRVICWAGIAFITGISLSVMAEPAAGPAKVLDVQNWKTENGSQVYFVKSDQIPIVDIALVFAAGSNRDGQNLGLANFTNGMLNESAGKLNADQIAQAFDNVGAEYSASVDKDMAVVALRSLSDPKFLQPALETFTQVITAPSFSIDAFQRVKKQLLQGLKLQQQSPEVIGSKAFFAKLYGKQAYGQPIPGTVASVSAFIPSQLKQFYQQYYVAQNAMVVLVGNLTKEQAKEIANQITKGLVAGKAAVKLPLAVASPQTGQALEQIPFPSGQTHIFMGQIGIDHHSPDYFPLIVGNYILGGQPLVARLFKQVRVERGLAYSIGSQFKPMQLRGPFVVSMQTRTDKAMEALQVSKKVLADFIQTGPTEAELEAAKKSIIGQFPLSLANNSDIADKVVFLSFYQLPADYLDTYRDKVAAVTIPQIQQAFKKNLNLEQMFTVMVGQFSKQSSNNEQK